MTTLESRFDAHFASFGLPEGPLLIAVSGGGDSLALLDLVLHAPSARHVTPIVLHVDHGIHPDSGAVARHVERVATRLGLPVLVEQLGLGPAATETRARAARLDAFAKALDHVKASVILTAHHADDQVETLLLRFVRGSGPAGLAGIAARRGCLVRPLLPFRRSELAAYAQRRGLVPWSDPANVDPRHDRSWLRLQIVPALEGRWPDLSWNLSGLASSHREERDAWEELLTRWPELEYRWETGGASVAASPLTGYSSSLRSALIRALARRAGVRVSRRQNERIQQLVAQGHTGRALELVRGGVAEVTFGRLRLAGRSARVPSTALALEGGQGSARFGPWTFAWRPDAAPARLDRAGLVTWLPAVGSFRIRAWQPGDRIRPIGGRGSRLVVRCMQDARVPRSRRPEWPILERDGVVIWAPGVCRSDAALPVAGSPAVRVDASRD